MTEDQITEAREDLILWMNRSELFTDNERSYMGLAVTLMASILRHANRGEDYKYMLDE